MNKVREPAGENVRDALKPLHHVRRWHCWRRQHLMRLPISTLLLDTCTHSPRSTLPLPLYHMRGGGAELVGDTGEPSNREQSDGTGRDTADNKGLLSRIVSTLFYLLRLQVQVSPHPLAMKCPYFENVIPCFGLLQPLF